jgi:hypothetical protein
VDMEKFTVYTITMCLREVGSSIGVVNGYGLDEQGLFPSSDRRFFSTAYRLALGPTQPPVQWVPEVLSPGVKWLGCEAD